MAHVESIIFFSMLIGFMSNVNFKKWPCRPVEFKGQGPSLYHWTRIGGSCWDSKETDRPGFTKIKSLVE